MTDTITFNGVEVTPLPRVKIYEKLIDHVNGFGKRHWVQSYWHSDQLVDEPTQAEEIRSRIKEDSNFAYTSAWSELNVCGSFDCVAGEIAAMHGIKHCWSFSYRTLAEAFGVSWEMETLKNRNGFPANLFAGHRTRDEILTELNHRLDVELQGSVNG